MDMAILVYVDNKKHVIEEFFWLYKSLIFSNLRSRCTIIAVCHPSAIVALPKDDRILVISAEAHADLSNDWNGYGYINSVANLCAKSVLSTCRNFEFVLKTDCDTFITGALGKFSPTGLCFGFGAYAYEEDVRRKLSECSTRWGFPHSGLHNVGASVLGPTEMVFNFLEAQMDYCNKLLHEEFCNYQGEWPGWCKNVLTMYAGELALRRTYPQNCSVGLLDHFPYANRSLGSDVLHIHAWHTEQYWSKQHFRAGMYAHVEVDEIDRNTLGGYCHWIAASTVENVKREMQNAS